jgi:sugar phosphate isomerase/epimerase
VIYDSTLKEALHYASKADWTGIAPDLGVPRFSPERITDIEQAELRELSAEYSLEWNLHAPGDDVSLFSTYPPIRHAILGYFKQVIDLARSVSAGVSCVTVHVGSLPSFRKAGERDDAFRSEHRDVYATTLRENLLALTEYAAPDTLVAVENVAWNETVREVLEGLVDRGLRLCLDIPKMYDANGLKQEDWDLFRRHKTSIEVVHVHDVRPGLGSHQVVGQGTLNFKEIIHMLSSLSIRPNYVFEVRPRELAEASLHEFGRIMEVAGSTL